MCKIVRLLYALVPVRRFRARLIRSHCAACRACLPDIEETERWTALVRPPEWISREAGYWPALERRLRGGLGRRVALEAAAPHRLLRRLTVAAGGILVVAILAVFVPKRPIPETVSPAAGTLEAPRVEVLSAELHGRPARSSVYQLRSASFIWFYPTPPKEDQR